MKTTLKWNAGVRNKGQLQTDAAHFGNAWQWHGAPFRLMEMLPFSSKPC
jgi:hypothetical protein